MEETVRPLMRTAEDGARAQTALMIRAFARDLGESVREFGLDDVREIVPRMLRGPRHVVDAVLEHLPDPDCETQVARYLEDHLDELWWFREQRTLAIRALSDSGTVLVGENLDELSIATVPDVTLRFLPLGTSTRDLDPT